VEVVILLSVAGKNILASEGMKCILPLLRRIMFNCMEQKCGHFRRNEYGDWQHKKFRFFRLLVRVVCGVQRGGGVLFRRTNCFRLQAGNLREFLFRLWNLL
jgi:hypothetical protein